MKIMLWMSLIGFLDLLAVSFVIPIVPLYFKETGKSPSLIGMYSSIYGIVQLLSCPLIGHWGDSYGRIEVLCICLVITALSYVACFFVFNSILALALIRVFLGLFKHTQDLCRTLIADASDDHEKNKNISQFNSISIFGFIIGPTVSGVISHHFGLSFAVAYGFLACASVCALNAIIVHCVVKSLNQHQKTTQSHSNQLNHDSSTNPTLQDFDWKSQIGIFLSRMLLAFSVMLYRSSFVLGLKHFFPDITALEIGYLSSYNAFISCFIGYGCSFIFSHPIYAQKDEKLQLHAYLIILLAFFIIATAKSIYIIMIGLAILAIGTSASKCCGISLTIKRCGTGKAGKILGFNSSFISLARSAAPISVGFTQEYSFAAPAYISLFVSLISLVLFYVTVYSRPIRMKVD